jgi:hypothetical protein
MLRGDQHVDSLKAVENSGFCAGKAPAGMIFLGVFLRIFGAAHSADQARPVMGEQVS